MLDNPVARSFYDFLSESAIPEEHFYTTLVTVFVEPIAKGVYKVVQYLNGVE